VPEGERVSSIKTQLGVRRGRGSGEENCRLPLECASLRDRGSGTGPSSRAKYVELKSGKNQKHASGAKGRVPLWVLRAKRPGPARDVQLLGGDEEKGVEKKKRGALESSGITTR